MIYYKLRVLGLWPLLHWRHHNARRTIEGEQHGHHLGRCLADNTPPVLDTALSLVVVAAPGNEPVFTPNLPSGEVHIIPVQDPFQVVMPQAPRAR